MSITDDLQKIEIEGLAATKTELAAKLKRLERALSIDELQRILDTTIKHDGPNKVISFLSMLLTYTDCEQINVGFLAESSTGKSYIPLELSWYFPSEDVIKLGYVSPTSFFHEQGRVEVEETFEGFKRVKIHVNLARKLLIFLDMPHAGLLERLRPLLSHDERVIEVRITDRNEKMGLKTKRVVVEGYPTVVFCSANESMNEQEKTRLLLLSPEKTQEKLWASLILKLEREGDREAFTKYMESEPSRVFLKNRVELIKTAGIKNIVIPKPLREAILTRFRLKRQYLQPRHTRDVSRLLALIKAYALLNYMHRPREGDSIAVTDEDLDVGFKLYEQISEPNELGISPELFEVYQAWRKQNVESFTITEFQKFYFKVFRKPIGYMKARVTLKNLAAAGLLTESTDEKDKRQSRFNLMEIFYSGGEGNSSPSPPEQNSLMGDSSPAPPKQNSLVFQLVAEFKAAYPQCFNNVEFYDWFNRKGVQTKDIEALLKRLTENGEVFSSSEGVWRWA